MKPNSRNVVTKLYVVAVLASALMGALKCRRSGSGADWHQKPWFWYMAPSPMAPVGIAVAKILEKDGYTGISCASFPRDLVRRLTKNMLKAAIGSHAAARWFGSVQLRGSIITEAGQRYKRWVAALVYIAAFALDESGELQSAHRNGVVPQASKAFLEAEQAIAANWWIEMQDHFVADFAADILVSSGSPWPSRKSRSPPTRSPTRSRIPPGRTSRRGTW